MMNKSCYRHKVNNARVNNFLVFKSAHRAQFLHLDTFEVSVIESCNYDICYSLYHKLYIVYKN